MPNITVRNWKNEPLREIELPDDVFAAPYHEHLVYEVVKAQLAAKRAGTHQTKTRSEVAGSGRKLWKQKHTGRARVGSIRSPLWRKGGTVHGPHPRDYSLKVNVKAKKAALRSVLSEKVQASKLLVLDRMDIEPAAGSKTGGGKRLTKTLAQSLASLGVLGKALLVDNHGNENLILASRNHPALRAVEARGVAVYDVLNADWVVVSEAALGRVTEVLR